MSAELLQLATQHGSKVRVLRSLYGFRLLLKKKNAEYKKVIGSKPEDEQSRLIMWNVLDPESKRLAASDGVSGMTYELCGISWRPWPSLNIKFICCICTVKVELAPN